MISHGHAHVVTPCIGLVVGGFVITLVDADGGDGEPVIAASSNWLRNII